MSFIGPKRQKWEGEREGEVTLVAFFGGTGKSALDGLAGLVEGISRDVVQ